MQNGQYRAGTSHKTNTLKAKCPHHLTSEAQECQQDSSCTGVCMCVCTRAFHYKMFRLLPASHDPFFSALFLFKFDGQEALGKDWYLILGGI